MRFDYSLLGDNVNLGSRLEGINKEYGTKITISESTYLPIKEKVIARLVDTVAVKGKAQGVKIYELRAMGRADFAEAGFLNDFEKAQTLYHGGKFKDALRLFKLFQEKYPDDGPAKTYVGRCEELVKHPPETWDGVYHAKSK
jgi:adenylate cyclase